MIQRLALLWLALCATAAVPQLHTAVAAPLPPEGPAPVTVLLIGLAAAACIAVRRWR